MTTYALPKNLRESFRPKPRETVSEWAQNFIIAEKGAVRPGPYDLSLTPYWREPLDAIGDPEVRFLIIVASAQCGKTTLGNIFIGHTATRRPCNVLYVRPTEDDVKEAFEDRFKPTIEANRELRALIPNSGSWLTVSNNPAIRLTSCNIYGAAASTPRQLTSRTCPKVMFDEIDNCDDSAGELGNTWSLVLERQMAASALHTKAIAMGTPNTEAGTNWQQYLKGDQRLFHEPCPLCGGYQALTLGHLVVPPGLRDPVRIRYEKAAKLRCDHCGDLIGQEWQGWMSDRGVWVPKGQKIIEPLPLNDKSIVEEHSLAILPDAQRWEPAREGEKPINPQRSYRIWRASTKFELCTWSMIIARYFEVQKNPDEMKVFKNAWEGFPWADAIQVADEDKIKNRIGVYEAREVPTRAKVMLAFVDVQQDCLWYAFRAFGPNQESWLIDFGSIEVSNRDHPTAFDHFYQLAFYRGFPIAGEIGENPLRMRAYAIAVDSGSFTGDVYEFSRRSGVVATKGLDWADYRIKPSQVEGKKTMEPVTIYWMNTTVFKDRLQRLIATQPGNPGEWHLHRDTTDEYITHLTAEHIVRKKAGKTKKTVRRYEPKTDGAANHLLDCEVGVLALGEILQQKGEITVSTLQPTDPVEGLFRAKREVKEPATPAQQPRATIRGFDRKFSPPR